MLTRIEAFSNGEEVTGVETPFRNSVSTEMKLALGGQKFVINALAQYKKWKIDNGYGNNDTFKTIGKEFAKQDFVNGLIIALLSRNRED